MKYHLIGCTFLFLVLLSVITYATSDDVSIENMINVSISKNFSATVQQELTLNLLNDKTAEDINTSIQIHTNHSMIKVSINQGSINDYYTDTHFLYLDLKNLSWTRNLPLKIYLNYSISNIVETENNLTYFDFVYEAFGNESPIHYFIVKMNVIFPYGLDSQTDEKYVAYFGLPTYDKNISVSVNNENPLELTIFKNVINESGDLKFRFIFILLDKPSFGVILKDTPSLENNEINYGIELTNLYNVSNVYYRINNSQLSIFDNKSPFMNDTLPRNRLENGETSVFNDKRDMILTKCSWIYDLIYPFECYIYSDNFNLASYFNPNIKPIDFVFEHKSEFSVPKNYFIDEQNSFILYCPEMVRFPSNLIEISHLWGFDIYSSPISTCIKSNFSKKELIENEKFYSDNTMPLHSPQYTTNIKVQIEFERSYSIIFLSFIIAIIPVIWTFFLRRYYKTKKSVQRNKTLYYSGLLLPIIGWFIFYPSFFDVNKIFRDIIFWMLVIIIVTIIYLEFFRKNKP